MSLYDGEFINEIKHGKGTMQWNMGEEMYEGDFDQGERTGKGKFTNKNGDVYQGDFVKGQWTGKGKYFIAASKTLYDGQFLKGIMTKGKITYVDGSMYQGEIKNW